MTKSEHYIPFNELPVMGRAIRRFDRSVGEKGVQETVANLIKRTGNNIEVVGRTERVEEILKNQAVLVVGNHPYDIEPIPLLATLPNREDIFMLGSSDFLTVGSNSTGHLIPIYISDQARDEGVKISARLGKWFRFGQRYQWKEAHKRNLESIRQAGERLSEGNLVIIFPQGAKGDKEWSSGIGHLVKGLETGNDIFYEKVHISGTSNFDALRLIPGLRRALPVIRVIYSEPQNISNIVGQENNPKRIRDLLEDNYKSWLYSI